MLAGSSLAAPTATWRDFQAGSFTSKGSLQIVYRIYIPKNYTPAKTYPLVMTLHGAGQWGNDDTLQLDTHFSSMWADSANQAKHPAFVLSPQCPNNTNIYPYGWMNTNWANGTYNYNSISITPNLQAVVELLDSISRRYSIDTLREYAAGMSMGGYASWYLMMRFPQRFAAVVPVCGAADTSRAASVKNVSVWAFHAADDNVVPVSGSRQMIGAITAVGGHPKYTEYPASMQVGHASWTPASLDTGLIPWVFSQARSGPVPVIRIKRNKKPAPASVIDVLGQKKKAFPALRFNK